MRNFYVLTTILLCNICFAESISIKNHTDAPLFAGIYYVDANFFGKSKGPATRIGPVVSINPGKKKILERPPYNFNCNREIIFSQKLEDIKSTLSPEEYKPLHTTEAGWSHGTKFHIAYDDNIMQGYDTVDWNIYKITNMFNMFIESIMQQYSQHPYADVPAVSKSETSLPQKENEYLAQRLPIVKSTLEQLLNIQLEDKDVPKISVCMSGGGMRAAMASLGLFEGLNQIDLLNGLTYACGLSGSTWFLAHYTYLGLPLGSYHELFIDALCTPHFFSISTVTDMLWKKYAFGQQMSIVDLYGVYLANTFFHHLESEQERQKITLSSLAPRVLPEKLPFPLFTAGETNEAFHWTTFTPHECTCNTLKLNCPSWAFGRTFCDGISTNFAPEQSLGFMMGIWGSALSGSLEEMLETQAHQLDGWLYNALQGVLSVTGLDDIRFATIKMHNPMYNVAHTPYKHKKDLIFVDAGYECNLPFMPLVEQARKSDIIIILDASENALQAPVEMQKAEKHLRSMGIELPEIPYEVLGKEPIVIMHDIKNPSAPILIYVAAVKNDAYDSTFDPKTAIPETYPTTRFLYNREDIEQFTGLIQFNIADNKERICAAIKDQIAMKTECLNA